MSTDPIALIRQKTSNWWQDDRRNWCAYCGVAIQLSTPTKMVADSATRDHVIPKKVVLKAQGVRGVTIPCCRECNRQKGNSDLPTFMASSYFAEARGKSRPRKWSMRDLWLVMALAAVEIAKTHADIWPADAKEAPRPQAKD